MKQPLLETKHSSKAILGCALVVALVVVLALSTNAMFLLFVIPCALMMGAMMWMMMGGRRGKVQ